MQETELVSSSRRDPTWDEARTDLVVPLERPPELGDESDEDELSDLGELCVYDCDEGGKDWSEGKRGRLGLHDRPRKQSASSDQVLPKQLGYNVLDVGSVDLENHTAKAETRDDAGEGRAREVRSALFLSSKSTLELTLRRTAPSEQRRLTQGDEPC